MATVALGLVSGIWLRHLPAAAVVEEEETGDGTKGETGARDKYANKENQARAVLFGGLGRYRAVW